MAKQQDQQRFPQQPQAVGASSSAAVPDRVELLAREMFISMANNVTGRTTDHTARECFDKAAVFYAVSDARKENKEV